MYCSMQYYVALVLDDVVTASDCEMFMKVAANQIHTEVLLLSNFSNKWELGVHTPHIFQRIPT